MVPGKLFQPFNENVNYFKLKVCNCRSPSINAKCMASNVHISSSEEQAEAEGKPIPSDVPMETLPMPEASKEPPTISTESQKKERAKKTKNNKGAKLDVPQRKAILESSSHTDENAGPLLNNKKNSFRQQYAKLPTNLSVRSTTCSIL